MEINRVYCANCVDIMKGMPSEFIDLTVTSPPYDNLRTYNGFDFDFESIAKGLYRVTKTGGVVVWIVGDETINGSETCTSDKQKLYFKSIGFNVHDTMIWLKDAPQYPDANRYYQVFEYMFILSKGKPKTTNFIEDKVNISYGRTVTGTNRTQKGDTKKVSCWGQPIKKFGRRYNVWDIPNTKGNAEIMHPAPFPEKLAEDHIISWSNKGDLVFDPMCGSGTTLKMAIKHHRNYIGVDCSQEYCDISERRISTVQTTLEL